MLCWLGAVIMLNKLVAVFLWVPTCARYRVVPLGLTGQKQPSKEGVYCHNLKGLSIAQYVPVRQYGRLRVYSEGKLLNCFKAQFLRRVQHRWIHADLHWEAATVYVPGTSVPHHLIAAATLIATHHFNLLRMVDFFRIAVSTRMSLELELGCSIIWHTQCSCHWCTHHSNPPIGFFL